MKLSQRLKFLVFLYFCAINVSALKLQENVEIKVLKENSRWLQLSDLVREAIESCKPRRVDFFEITFIDLCKNCDVNNLFKTLTGHSENIFNSVIGKLHSYRGAEPDFVIVVLDKLDDVRNLLFLKY